MADDKIEFTIEGKDKASSAFNSVGGAVTKLAAAAAATVAAFGYMIKSAADAQDHISDLHKQTGLSVESLSELSHIAVIANADIDGLAQGMRFLSKSASESTMAGSQAATAYRMLGVSAKDSNGNLKSTEMLISELADKFNSIQDPIEKTNLGVQVFGRGWKDAAKMMAEGSEGMKRLAADAEFLGVKMTAQGVSNANAFNDQLDRVGQAVKGASMAIANEWIPILTGFARSTADAIASSKETLRAFSADLLSGFLTTWATIEVVGGKVIAKIEEWFSSAEGFDNFVENAGRAFNYMFEVAALALQHIVVMMGAMFKLAWESFVEIGKWAWGKVKGIFSDEQGPTLGELLFNKIPEATAETRAELGDAFKMMKTEWVSTIQEGAEGAAEVFNISSEEISARVDEIKKKFTELGEAEKTAAEQSEIDERLRHQRQLQEQITFLEQKSQAMESHLLFENERAEMQDELTRLRIQMANENEILTTQEKNMLLERMELQKQARLGSIHAQAELNRRQVSQMNLMAQLQYTSSALSTITGLMQSENEKQFKIGKAASIAQAVINTYTAAVNAYMSASAIPIVGWILGPIAAAAAVAMGMAQVSKIKSTQFTGQAHAGMTNVPSEGTYLLDKGERVLSPSQNSDLTNFMKGGGEGGEGTIHIDQLSISVLENATSFESLMNMSERQIRELIAGKLIPALNVLNNQGIRPDFVERYRR